MAQQPQKAKIVLVVGLAAVLGIVLLLRLHLLPFGSGPAASGSGAKAGQPAPHPGPETSSPIRLAWKRPAPIGPIARDPTHTDVAQNPPAPEGSRAASGPAGAELTMAGIVFNTAQPSSVIIGGAILHEGDTLGDVTVTRIAPDHAELHVGGQTRIIKPGESCGTPAPARSGK